MRDELREVLERQAAWQRARATQSWAEKLRTAVVMRQALMALRKSPSRVSEGAGTLRK